MLLISLNVSLLPWVKDKSERSSEKKIWEQFWGNWGAVQNFGSCYFWVQGGGKIYWKIAERLEKLWKPWEISPLCLYHTLGFESRLLWRPNTCETVMFPTTNSVEWNGICPWLEPKMRSFVQLTSFFAFGGLSSFDDLWLEGPQIITHAPWEYAPPLRVSQSQSKPPTSIFTLAFWGECFWMKNFPFSSTDVGLMQFDTLLSRSEMRLHRVWNGSQVFKKTATNWGKFQRYCHWNLFWFYVEH